MANPVKKTKKGYKALSLLLSLVMVCGYVGLFSGLIGMGIFGTKQTAEAINSQTAGKYYVTVSWYVEESKNDGDNRFTLYYKKQDGSEGDVTYTNTTKPSDGSWASTTYELDGVPYKVWVKVYGRTTDQAGWYLRGVYVSPNSDYTTDKTTLWEGEFGAYVAHAGGGSTSNTLTFPNSYGSWGSNGSSKKNNTTAYYSGSYTPSPCATLSGNHTVYLTSGASETRTYTIGTVKDQFGVNWGFSNISSWSSSDTNKATVSGTNTLTATFKWNNGTRYNVTLSPNLNTGNSSGEEITVIPCESLQLNTEKIVNHTDENDRYYVFTPPSNGKYVFFTYDTDNTPDPYIYVYTKDTSASSGLGSTSVASKDDGGDNTIRKLLGGSSSAYGTWQTWLPNVALTGGTSYIVRAYDRNEVGTYPMKVCKSVDITFNATGGATTFTKTLAGGHSLYLGQVGIAREGHTLLAWSTNENGAQTKTHSASQTTTVPTSNSVFSALWYPNNAPTLTVNTDYDAVIDQGGEVEFFQFTPTETRKYVLIGKSSTDTFALLYKASDWQNNVTYLTTSDDDGRSDFSQSGNQFFLNEELTAGTTYLYGVKYYYRQTEDNNGDDIDLVGTIPFRFEPVYKVEYDANGGTGAPSTQDKFVNKNLTLSSALPTRTGYTFLGWSASKTAATATYAAGGTYTANADLKLYAVWQPISYTISYSLDGGSVSGNPTSYTIESSPVVLNNPTKTGYTFIGWTGSNGTTPQMEVVVPNGVSTGLSGYTTSNPYTANDRDNRFGPSFTVQPGTTYRVFVTAKRTSGTLDMQGGIWYTSQTSGDHWDGYGGTFTCLRDAGNGWGVYYKDVTVPAGKQEGQFYIQLEQSHGGAGHVWLLADCAVMKLSLGDLSYTANWQINKYTVVWKNYDGTVLETDNNVEHFSTPQYNGVTPAKPYDDDYHYTFSGWSPAIAEVAGAVTYTAQFTSAAHAYGNWTKVSGSDNTAKRTCACGREETKQITYNDTFVVDSAVLLDVLGNDLDGTGSQAGSGLTLKTENGLTGLSSTGVTISVTNNRVALVPQGLLSGKVTFTYTARYDAADYTAGVTVIPASNIYLEESVFTFNNGADSTAVWHDDGTASEPAFGALLDGKVGSAYNSANSSLYSMGTAKYAVVSKAHPMGPTATFRFTGTGFELYTVTDNRSGTAVVTITGGDLAKPLRKVYNTYFGYSYDPDNGWQDNADTANGLYQVPVISQTGLTYGTYEVTVQPRHTEMYDAIDTCRFYIDAVRVFDPIDPAAIQSGTDIYNAYVDNLEYDAHYQKLRDILIDKDAFNVSGSGLTNVADGVAFISTAGYQSHSETPAELQTYIDLGPKNEVYLEPGEGIAFNLTTTGGAIPAKLCIGVRAAQGSGSVTVKGTTYTVDCATELYRKIAMGDGAWTDNGDGTYTTKTPIVIINSSSGAAVIALTNLKWSFGEKEAAKSASARSLKFSFALSALHTLDLTEQSDGGGTLDGSAVTVTWDKETFELGETATLTITAPDSFLRAFVDGEEIAGYEELPDGRRQWTYTVTAEELGVLPADVTLEDANEYRTGALKAPQLTATEPTVTLAESAITWENDSITLGETAVLKVTAPANAVSVTVHGEEITLFELREDGSKVFTWTVTPETAGEHRYTVTAAEGHGYGSDEVFTPALTVNEPAPETTEAPDVPEPPTEGPADGAQDEGIWSIRSLLDAILRFFRKVLELFKVKA